MKKLLIAIAATLTLIMTSCGGTDLKSVNEKIEKDGVEAKFTQEEYNAIISYLSDIYDSPESLKKAMEGGDEQVNQMLEYTGILLSAKEEGLLDESTSKKLESLDKKVKSFNLTDIIDTK